jgi:hypothetical protein
MRLPRVSIADVMALTVLVALDCLAWKDYFDDGLIFVTFRLLILPVLNVLAISLYVAIGKMRKGEPIPFLASFLVIGGLTVVVESVGVAWYIVSQFSSSSGDVYYVDHVTYEGSIVLATLVATIIQLLPALLGAAFYRFFKIRNDARRLLVAVPSVTDY